MRKALLIAILAAGCGGGGDDGGDDDAPPTGPIAARIDHYHYRFDLESRAATATLTATVEVAGDCLELPFRAQDLGGVRLDGTDARSANVANERATICGAGYPAGHELAIDVAMTIPAATWGPSDVGYSITPDQWGNPMYYLVSWIGGCDRFGPCDNRPDRFARYTFEVTHPADITVRCPGTVTAGATTTTCDFQLAGGPTYSTFGVIGSRNWQVATRDFAGIAVEIYDHVQTGMTERIDDAYHAGFIDFLRGHFGAFPFGTDLRILVGPTYWAGFEHPGNIVLSNTLARPGVPGQVRYADPVAHVLNHEIAHQWAGDQTTLADTYDFVWKEAMVEYLTHVYEDQTAPQVAAQTRNLWKASSIGALYHPVPEERPALLDFYGDVYGPGPLILFHQVEKLSSRAQVLTALEGLLGTPRALSVAEVEAALAAATGLDLDDYFAAWAHGTGAPVWPTYAVSYAAGILNVTQANAASGVKPCVFKVTLRGDNGESMTVDVDTFRNGPDQSIPVTPAFAVTQTFVDLENDCLALPALATSAPAPRVNPWVAR
jgi:aminopeptidase N